MSAVVDQAQAHELIEVLAAQQDDLDRAIATEDAAKVLEAHARRRLEAASAARAEVEATVSATRARLNRAIGSHWSVANVGGRL